jgi:hypothetical protein
MQELSACGKQEIPIRKFWPVVEKPFELITCDFMFGEEALYRSKAQTIRPIVPVVASNNLPHPLLWQSLTFPLNVPQWYEHYQSNGRAKWHIKR